jgi:hypothetical protein
MTPAHRPALHNHQQEAPLIDEPLDEPPARAINAQAWEPPPGMVKRQCPECRYWFAVPVAEVERHRAVRTALAYLPPARRSLGQPAPAVRQAAQKCGPWG